jgi:acetyl esterase/lipase
MFYTQGAIKLLILILFSFQMVGLSAEDAGYSVLRDLSYGDPLATDHPDQTLDLYTRDHLEKRAVIIYVHGGGWAFGDKEEVHGKPEFFVSHNTAFISMNYRKRWDYTVYDQVSDLVRVVLWVGSHADQYGLDPDKIILVGHASGAHLVSLVGTDERYLKASGLSFGTLAGVVSIENDAYDIPRHIEETASPVEKVHLSLIFGENPEVWRVASPSAHVAKNKNIPAFALVYSTSNKATSIQATAFAKLLAEAEVQAILVPDSKSGSKSVDESLGRSGDQTTMALITFIRAKI